MAMCSPSRGLPIAELSATQLKISRKTAAFGKSSLQKGQWGLCKGRRSWNFLDDLIARNMKPQNPEGRGLEPQGS